MYTLQIALKNGKLRNTAPMPVAQAFELRHQLISCKVAQIPGIGRINGEWVAGVTVLAAGMDAGMDADTLLNTDQAAGCMRAEPYVHYRLLGGTLYQYSEMTQGYEACVRGVWRSAILPLGAWVRVGGDSLAFLVAGDGESEVWTELAV